MRVATISAVTLAAAMTFASCGGSGSTGAVPSAPTVTGGNSGQPSGASIAILGTLGAQSFSPNPSSVTQGATVSWVNSDSVTHHIVMDDGSLDTGNIAPGASSAALQMASSGGTYHCTIHPSMVGSINRQTPAPPPCSGAYCDSIR